MPFRVACQAASGVLPCCSTETMPLLIWSLMVPACGPLVAIGIFCAAALNRVPSGALLKYGSLAVATLGSAAAVALDGKCWPFTHIVTCCSGAVSHLASS